MAKLEANVDKFLQETFKERTELDWYEDPEVDNIEDPIARKKAADDWFESRMGQLKQNEFYDITTLRDASKSGYLEIGNLFEAERKLGDMYKKIKERSLKIYQETIGKITTST